jgi:hypothetical protein
MTAAPIVREIRKFKRRLWQHILIRWGILDRFKGKALEETFNTIYGEGLWGKGLGLGSEGLWADGYISFVRTFIEDKGIKSITDVGCVGIMLHMAPVAE